MQRTPFRRFLVFALLPCLQIFGLACQTSPPTAVIKDDAPYYQQHDRAIIVKTSDGDFFRFSENRWSADTLGNIWGSGSRFETLTMANEEKDGIDFDGMIEARRIVRVYTPGVAEFDWQRVLTGILLVAVVTLTVLWLYGQMEGCVTACAKKAGEDIGRDLAPAK